MRTVSTHCFCLFVRAEGLEPPSREALDPKSSVSTNFTTPASSSPGGFFPGGQR